MRTILLLLSLATLAAPLPPRASAAEANPAASSPEAKSAVSRSAGAALQADAGTALAALRAVPAEAFAGKDAAYRACVLSRLGDDPIPTGPDPGDPLVGGVVRAYQAYWRRAMKDPSARTAAEAALADELRRILATTAADDALEAELDAAMSRRGLHRLGGRTAPLLDLMLWRKQTSVPYTVALPEGRHTTRVEILDDFLVLGWGAWATCELHSTGGWATDQALFAVRPRYKSLEDEVFKVSFLGHETQHFADKNRFPGLQDWELEYRAKLTELALAETSRQRILGRFVESQGDDPGSPHAYANRRVLTDLRARLALAPDADLSAVEPSALRRAARETLIADSARRIASAKPAPAR